MYLLTYLLTMLGNTLHCLYEPGHSSTMMQLLLCQIGRSGGQKHPCTHVSLQDPCGWLHVGWQLASQFDHMRPPSHSAVNTEWLVKRWLKNIHRFQLGQHLGDSRPTEWTVWKIFWEIFRRGGRAVNFIWKICGVMSGVERSWGMGLFGRPNFSRRR